MNSQQSTWVRAKPGLGGGLFLDMRTVTGKHHQCPSSHTTWECQAQYNQQIPFSVPALLFLESWSASTAKLSSWESRIHWARNYLQILWCFHTLSAVHNFLTMKCQRYSVGAAQLTRTPCYYTDDNFQRQSHGIKNTISISNVMEKEHGQLD
jgi:hypothetical protein